MIPWSIIFAIKSKTFNAAGTNIILFIYKKIHIGWGSRAFKMDTMKEFFTSMAEYILEILIFPAYTILLHDVKDQIGAPYTHGVIYVFAFHFIVLCIGWCCCIAFAFFCMLCAAPVLIVVQALTPFLFAVWLLVNFEFLVMVGAACCSVLCCGAVLCVGVCVVAYFAATCPLAMLGVFDK